MTDVADLPEPELLSSPIDLQALETTPLAHDPFDHVVVRNFVPAGQLVPAIQDFPATPGSGAYVVGQAPPGAFRALVKAMTEPAFAVVVGRKFGVDLAALPTLCTVRGWCGPRDGRIHTDTADKVVTALLYLNAEWREAGGRLRLLRSARSLADYAVEIPPDQGTLLLFRRSKTSWHGHPPFEGPRRVLQVNWITRGDFLAFKQLRLRAAAAATAMLAKTRPS